MWEKCLHVNIRDAHVQMYIELNLKYFDDAM